MVPYFLLGGGLFLNFKEPGLNINADRYLKTLTRLRVNFKNKRSEILQEVLFFSMIMRDPM